MAFRDMFTRLPAVEEDGKMSFTRRNETKSKKRKISNYRKKRQSHVVQSAPPKGVKRPRFMTQEFKDQNVLSVDGRSLCRHFLWDKCIKGDDCQLEHVQGYNDLIKERCKFYVQGFCTKGERCPYMHKTFPCKFFHGKAKCFQGADCRFSHEPLNDVTQHLLDEALKQEQDLYELAKKATEESPGRPEKADESETSETNSASDVLPQPLRFSFYNSAETAAGRRVVDKAQEAAPPHTPETTQPHQEPVCDSAEAVVGLQQSKPFLTAPRPYERAPLLFSYCTPDAQEQSQVPYSVGAVLRSRLSVEGSTNTPHSAHTVSYSPKMHVEEVIGPLLRLETQTKEVSHASSAGNDADKSQEKMSESVSSLRAPAGPGSKTSPNPPLVPLDHRKPGGTMPESPKPAQTASRDVKEGLPSSHITRSVDCDSEGVDHIVPKNHTSSVSRPPCQTSASRHPKQLKPPAPPFRPSSVFSELKTGTAVRIEPALEPDQSANSASRQFAPTQPAEIHLHSEETRSGLKLASKRSTETAAQRSGEEAPRDDLLAACKTTLKRPFKSLFATPITDTLQPVDVSPPQHPVQSSRPVPQATSQPHPSDKNPVSPFRSLFAAPLPCLQPRPDHSGTPQRPMDDASHSSDSKRLASHSETPLPRQVRAEETPNAPRSPSPSPDSKIKTDSSTELAIHPAARRPANPDRPPACGGRPFTSHAREELPSISSHRGFAAAATAKSSLKTLFLSLSPFKQEGEQQDVPSGIHPSGGQQVGRHRRTVQ